MTPSLLVSILGREASLFGEDVAREQVRLRERVGGARVLVVGAAGSIGAATVKQLIPFRPAALHLVDPSENNLVELVRDLRSSDGQPPDHFKTVAIEMGGLAFDRFLTSEKPYDHILNFAAMKHVRSERDPFSFMRMLDTNLFALHRLLEAVAFAPPRGVFSVSSDKAVNPQNAMGASKAIMEAILWHHSEGIPCTSARFANVAFSDGSLLHGFIRRFEKGQPLSAPEDVQRYFISHTEAGQLCLLAAFTGNSRDIFIPRLTPQKDLLTFSHIARLFVESRGYRPRVFHDEAEARAFAARMQPSDREWPCCFTPSDTTGEKPFEEFFHPGEPVDWDRFRQVGVVTVPPFRDAERLLAALAALQALRAGGNWQRREMIAIMKTVVPTLRHEEKGRNLDQKM